MGLVGPGLSHHLAAPSLSWYDHAARSQGSRPPVRIPQTSPELYLLERREAGVLYSRAGGDAERVGGAEQVGGDGWGPCLLLGQWGLHDEAFPAAAAPRAGVLPEGRGQGVRAGAVARALLTVPPKETSRAFL